jgi:hypothetical protein
MSGSTVTMKREFPNKKGFKRLVFVRRSNEFPVGYEFNPYISLPI